MHVGSSKPARWRFGVFEVDAGSGELRKQGSRIRLADQSFQVLLALLERPGQVVTRQQLHERLWPGDTFVDFDANLNTAISLLREALGDSAKSPHFIETLPRRGYRFLGEVFPAAAGDEPRARVEPDSPVPSLIPRRLVLAAAVLVLLVLGGLAFNHVWIPAPTVDSIAVLPLVYAGPQADGDQEYLADGMTSALITELARRGVPNVISETSVMQYRDATKPLPVIARELGAEVVIEGSVVREGNIVRVNAQLIDARTDRHIWARSYHREMDSILALQDELAAAIVREIRVRLPSAMERTPPPKVNPHAQEAYLRGRHALRNELEGRRGRALAFFEEAIRLDPSLAPAYAGLAEYYGLTDVLPPSEALPKSRQYALKALELDDSLAGPHLSLALASLWGDWDWAGAERGFKRSLDLDPNDATTRRWYALLLDLTGQPRAANDQLQRVRQLDPVSPHAHYALAYHLFVARRYDEALEQIGKVQELAPHDPKAIEGFGTLYVYKGAYDQAIAASEQGIALWGREPPFLVALAVAQARAGNRGKARALLDEVQGLTRTRHIPPCWFALMHMNLGEIDRAFEWLERALELRDVYLLHLKVSPLYDPVRGDPRYQNLLRRMNFPHPNGV